MKTIIGFFDTVDEVRSAVDELRSKGVNDISYITSRENFFDRNQVPGAKDMSTGQAAGEGAVIGGLSGLALAAIAIPGFGPLFAAGPILGVLGGGVITGGIVGALAGWGVGAEQAQGYEKRIKEGEAMLAADISVVDEAQAKEAMESHGAKEVETFKS